MRNLKLVLLGSLMVAGLLVGPGLGSAAAATNSYTFFTCHPNGSSGAGPSTTTSAAIIDFTTPGNSKLTCFFPSVTVATSGSPQLGGNAFGGIAFGGLQLGGPCTFDTPSFTVAFSHRIYSAFGNTASLVCWGGAITILTPTLSTVVHYGGDGGPAIFDSIAYSNGGTFSCASQAEDGVTSCDHIYTAGTVVTVTLTDDAQFMYICPGDPFMYQSTSGPFTGSCTVTMNGDQQVFVVGNEQL